MLFDVIAVIIGISYTLRRLSLAKLEIPASEAPPAGFEAWRLSQLGAYKLGASVCFAKVVFANGFMFTMGRMGVGDENWTKRGVSMAIDVLWLLGLALAMIKSHKAQKVRKNLGLPAVFAS
ncbi:MAG: hypothetical protein SFV15_03285 [Polyangiaceae bacterium]|nr:hypothetical protein [Polyangiaceae bacterium]